jgi:hypothetical protein
MLNNKIDGKKKSQLEKMRKNVKSIELTHQTCSQGHVG